MACSATMGPDGAASRSHRQRENRASNILHRCMMRFDVIEAKLEAIMDSQHFLEEKIKEMYESSNNEKNEKEFLCELHPAVNDGVAQQPKAPENHGVHPQAYEADSSAQHSKVYQERDVFSPVQQYIVVASAAENSIVQQRKVPEEVHVHAYEVDAAARNTKTGHEKIVPGPVKQHIA